MYLSKLAQAMPLGGFWISALIFSALTSFILIQINNKEDLYWAWENYYEELDLRRKVGNDVYAVCKDGTVFEDYKANEIGGGCWKGKHGGPYYDQYFSDKELERTPDQRVFLEKIKLLIFYIIGLLVLVEKSRDLHDFFFNRD
ncbi:hypothetical protein [Psychrobacter frigidicola]|uniref:hypothetical protein n=1 Tax=Psychrobacter frigidicola TaxID=45611 RepID=UPI00191B5D6D|nr:hypothetical protein [Psychrobacter frigidicola]